MLSLAVALLVAAAPVANADLVRARVLVTDAKGGAPRDVKGVVTRELATTLTTYSALEVLAFSDLRHMVELESARQMTACDVAKLQACLADLQSALGVPWAVFVDVDEVGTHTNIGLALVAADGSALARQTVDVADLTQLSSSLTPAVRRLVTPLYAALNVPLPPDPTVVVDDDAGSGVPFVVAGVGGVVALASGVAVVVGAQPVFAHDAARAELARLRSAAADDPSSTTALLTEAEAQQRAQRDANAAWQAWGQAVVVAGAVGVVVGVAAAAGGVVWGVVE